MTDTELRTAERRWRDERTLDAGRAFVAASVRRGPAHEDERRAWRAAVAEGRVEAAEALFLDAWLRGDPDDARIACETLAGTPGRDGDAPQQLRRGVVRAPCALDWATHAASTSVAPGEDFLVAWLATLSSVDRLFLWSRALLQEPAVTDAERDAVCGTALAGARADLDGLAERHRGVVPTVTWPVLYSAGGFMEGGPPTIERTFPRLVHGVLRRALLAEASTPGGSEATAAVVRAVLERPESLLPSRPELRLASEQVVPYWRSPRMDVEVALEVAAEQLRDAYALRGALSLVAALPRLLGDPAIADAVDRLVASSDGEVAARALSFDLAPAVARLPRPLALRLVSRAAGWTVGHAPLVRALLQHASAFDDELRRAAEATLLALATGGSFDAFEPHLGRALADPDGVDPWLRDLAPRLVRALVGSGNVSARIGLAALWQGQGVERYPALADVWRLLSEDPDEYVRQTLASGEIDY